MPLPTRKLGRTGLDVTVLGFGGAPLGDLYARIGEAAAAATLEAALDAGITLFDVAPLYGSGLAELRFGHTLRQRPRQSFILSTKVGRLLEAAPGGIMHPTKYVGALPFEVVYDYGYDGVLRSLEHSLARLGLASVDILLIHDVDPYTHGPDGVEARFEEVMGGGYKALERLRAERIVKGIGIGVNVAEMCVRFAQAGDFDCMLLAGRYTLLEQPALTEFMPLAEKKGIGVMLGGVFNSGILATGAVEGAKYQYADAPEPILAKVRSIERVCRAHATPLPVAAMHFCLGHPAVASLVLGAVGAEEVRRNVAALSAKVPAGLWRDLVAEELLDAAAPVPA
jgi:D-threo-aldose 1-dehydrogenase